MMRSSQRSRPSLEDHNDRVHLSSHNVGIDTVYGGALNCLAVAEQVPEYRDNIKKTLTKPLVYYTMYVY